MNFYPKISGFIRLQILYNILSHNRELFIFLLFFSHHSVLLTLWKNQIFDVDYCIKILWHVSESVVSLLSLEKSA